MTTVLTFVPSGTPVSFTPTETSTTAALPTVDGGNTDLMVSSTAPTPVYLTFGTAVALGNPSLRGEIVVPPTGQPVLLTATQATVAATTDPLVLLSNGHAAATNVAVITGMRGGTVTIQRGTATARNTF